MARRRVSHRLFAAFAALVLASCGGGLDIGIGTFPLDVPTPSQAASSELADAFAATLTGADETPSNASTARGTGGVVVNPATREMLASVVTSGIIGTAAHIHEGAPGTSGAIVFPLTETVAGSGVWSTRLTLTQQEFASMKAGNYYFNVHSAAFPDGEIRGQIALQGISATDVTTTGTGSTIGGVASPLLSLVSGIPSGTAFVASLKGAQVVPATSSSARGAGSVVINPLTRQLVAAVVAEGIAATGAHVRLGAPGVEGPVIIALTESVPGGRIWVAQATINAAQYDSLKKGNLYFELESAPFPGGEIRGQLQPQTRFVKEAIGATTTTAFDNTPIPTIGISIPIGSGGGVSITGSTGDATGITPLDTAMGAPGTVSVTTGF